MKEDLLAQYGALREGCGLWSDSARSLLTLAGEDRSRLLNGLVTCDVQNLELGRGVRGFFTDVKGHILTEVVVRAGESLLWLELPTSREGSIASHINKYIVADRVEVNPVEDRQALTIAGPQSAAVLAEFQDNLSIPDSPWDLSTAVLGHHEALVSAEGHLGVPAFTLWTSPSATPGVRRALLAQPMPVAEVELAAVEILRVEQRVPRFGVDYGPDNLPQETGIEDAVSYSKGCYLGQEVVARLHYRGQVARRLCALQSSSEDLPAIGSPLSLDGREAGVVTSAVRSPATGAISALAMLQRRALEEGTVLWLDGDRSMRVV